MRPPKTILLDARNWDVEASKAIEAIAACKTLVGLDCETQDDGRHDGLNQFMKVNEETRKKAGNKRLVFDMRRTVMTGFDLPRAPRRDLLHQPGSRRRPKPRALEQGSGAAGGDWR